MGTEDPSHANFPSRSAASPFPSPQSMMPFLSSRPSVGSQVSTLQPSQPPAPQTTTPFLSSGPVVGSDASSVIRSSLPPVSQTTAPFLSSRPVVGSEASGFRPMPPGRYITSSMNPSPPSYGLPAAGPFQRFPPQQFSLTAQVSPPRTSTVGQSAFPQPTKHPVDHVSSMSAFQSLQPHIPSVPMGSVPRSINTVPSSMNFPQSSVYSLYSAPRPNMQQFSHPTGLSYPAARGSLQSALPGYPGMQPTAVTQAPPLQPSAFLTHQGGYVPPPPGASTPFLSPQVGYATPPSVAPPVGLYLREQTRPPGSGPPVGAAEGLIEDFRSLSLGSVPGSFDSRLDSKAWPRPLDGDVEPRCYAEMYPMNCNSRYLWLTTSAIPNSQSLVSRWHLPLGAFVCPLVEAPNREEVPIVNFSLMGIIRCRRCLTYVNPYVTFTDGGRKWQCNICVLLNEGDYFGPLDASGRRIDLDQRPELIKGSVEFVAPTEYMLWPPMPPLYFFLIDVSISAVRSGMLEVVAQTIKSCLDKLPGSPRTQIGFITYDSTIHFYNMKSSLTQPQMMVVSDLDDIFVPLPDDLLVNLSESRSVVDAFLDSLPSMFQDNVNVESAFGPALKATFMIMSPLGGKLLIFQNTLPSLGVGRLRLRGDDLRVYEQIKNMP